MLGRVGIAVTFGASYFAYHTLAVCSLYVTILGLLFFVMLAVSCNVRAKLGIKRVASIGRHLRQVCLLTRKIFLNLQYPLGAGGHKHTK